MMQTSRFLTYEAMSQEAASVVRHAIGEKADGAFSLCLSGGGTPRRLYELLADVTLPWERIHLFWGDERAVPPDHPQSNYFLARSALIDRISIPPGNVHPMANRNLSLERAAEEYELELTRFFGTSPPNPFPGFDFTLLGIGPDGHTASLFPGSPALGVRDSWVTAAETPEGISPSAARITLTLPVFNASKRLLFLSSLEGKEDVLEAIVKAGANGIGGLPASMIRSSGSCRLFLFSPDT